MPAVTAAHQQAAFQAFAWTGWTYEQAMADQMRSRWRPGRLTHPCHKT